MAIDPTRINPAHLRVLIAVSATGSFTQAALELQTSQSAVSYAISALEDELGVILVSRGRHGAHLTRIGEQIVSQAYPVLQLLADMVQAANATKGLHGGSLKIACFRSAATHILPSLLAQFRDRFPEIVVVLTEYARVAEVEQALQEGRVDLGFTVLPTSQGFETWKVVRDEYIVLLPPNAQIPPTGLTWDILAHYSFITCSMNTCHAPVYQHLAKHQALLKTVYDVQESSTAVSLVAQGLGATILARLSALPIPPEIQVHPLPISLERVIGVAASAKALRTPAMFAFLDLLPHMSDQCQTAPVESFVTHALGEASKNSFSILQPSK